MKKKIVPVLLSLTVALSFSLVGADFGFAADSIKDSAKPIAKSLFQNADNNFDKQNFTKKDTATKTIKAGTTAYLPKGVAAQLLYGTSGQTKTTWLKIKPSASGAVSFSVYTNSTVQLCNAKKRALSPVRKVGLQYSSQALQNIFFGVKAGTTYYLKLRGSGLWSDANGQYIDAVAYVNNKATGKYGKSAKRAAKLKRGVSRYGFLQTTSKPKYYTFKKRGHNIVLTLPAVTDGSLKATVTVTARGMYKYKKTYSLTRYNQGQSVKFYTSNGRAYSMKCIVKVSRSGKSSGAFGVVYK